MVQQALPPMPRRNFLKLAGMAAVATASDKAQAVPRQKLWIVIDPDEPLTSSPPVAWALDRLRRALRNKGVETEDSTPLATLGHSSLIVVLAKSSSPLAASYSTHPMPTAKPESVALLPGHANNVPALLIAASDMRGFVYGLLELFERVTYGNNALAALHLSQPVIEQPANKVRSIARAFCSELEDKPWYYDKEFWRGYLDVLAASRFNRFNFAFGFGYDFPKGVTDDYFHFPYPYLLDVPGYDVRVVPLKEGERERNLQMLQFIAAETVSRGIQFQLGLWTHAYAWTDSPNSTHHISGLTTETHAAYCRDALAMLLKVCPQIEGLTLRVHGESGIPEGSYAFWKTLFEAITQSGRTVEIDMHAKGINQTMIDMASATGMPVKVSAKFWAEHQGLGYHQADIRELEIPRPDRMEQGVFSVSNGERRFTRYGYADLFQEGRKFDVLFRLWPGTQRHLLWGDPAAAAAYGRASHFCGAAGIDICEPLTFKGREGSGQTGGRCAYADATLNPKSGDWQKFEYTYRLWGRLLYNPDTDPEVWRRYLRSDFGSAAQHVEDALANAGRVLPLLTTAHLPSASNHSFWPEIYENMPIVLGAEPSPYSDTPSPKCFGTVSPLDPQIFSTIQDHVNDTLSGRRSAKYSPVEVAQWLDEFTSKSEASLLAARRLAAARSKKPAFRRMEEDVLIQIGLGKFFAAKLRSGMLFELYQQGGDSKAGHLAQVQYQKARNAWAAMAERAKQVYSPDISYGSIEMRRGHWLDRLAHIDADISAMQKQLRPPNSQTDSRTRIGAVMDNVKRPTIRCTHTVAKGFAPGQPLVVQLVVDPFSAMKLLSVQLHYRHVNQGERWQTLPMQKHGETHQGVIGGEYTASPYPLQYYFELSAEKIALLHPSLDATLSNEPYYVVFRRTV